MILLFLLGASVPTANFAAVPATAATGPAAPPVVVSPSYTNGELAERENDRGQGIRRGARNAAPLPPPGTPGAPDRAPAVRTPATGGHGIPPRTDDGRHQPAELPLLHCVFRC
ncbi:hypothetical protein [Streptomyces sp. NPDC002067]